MPTLAQVVEASIEREELLASIGAAMREDLREVSEGFLGQLRNALAGLMVTDSPVDAGTIGLAIAGQDLAQMLDDAGFDEAVEGMLSRYQDILNAGVDGLALQGVAVEMLETDLLFLQSLAEMDDARWLLIGREWEAAARQAVMGQVLGTLTLEGVAAVIEGAVGTQHNRSILAARTMLSSYHRNSQNFLAHQAGLNSFLYVGPSDGITRPFCAPLVGKVLTREEIATLDNGQIDNPLVSGGGYNCRHHWAPVADVLGEMPRPTQGDLDAANDHGGRGGPTVPRRGAAA